jgi:hypothetical protein
MRTVAANHDQKATEIFTLNRKFDQRRKRHLSRNAMLMPLGVCRENNDVTRILIRSASARCSAVVEDKRRRTENSEVRNFDIFRIIEWMNDIVSKFPQDPQVWRCSAYCIAFGISGHEHHWWLVCLLLHKSRLVTGGFLKTYEKDAFEWKERPGF